MRFQNPLPNVSPRQWLLFLVATSIGGLMFAYGAAGLVTKLSGICE